MFTESRVNTRFVCLKSFDDYQALFGVANCSKWFTLVQPFDFSRVIVEKFVPDYENGGGKFIARREWGNFNGEKMSDAQKAGVRASVSAACWVSLSGLRPGESVFITLC